MADVTPSHTPQPQPKLIVKPLEPLYQEPTSLSKTRALPKRNPFTQPQEYKLPKGSQVHKTTAKFNKRWVPKALLQAQGFYKGKASIWLLKQGQKQVHQPQQQAQQTLQKSSDKLHQKSACTITSLASKTINPKPRMTYQCTPQTTGSVHGYCNYYKLSYHKRGWYSALKQLVNNHLQSQLSINHR